MCALQPQAQLQVSAPGERFVKSGNPTKDLVRHRQVSAVAVFEIHYRLARQSLVASIPEIFNRKTVHARITYAASLDCTLDHRVRILPEQLEMRGDEIRRGNHVIIEEDQVAPVSFSRASIASRVCSTLGTQHEPVDWPRPIPARPEKLDCLRVATNLSVQHHQDLDPIANCLSG